MSSHVRQIGLASRFDLSEEQFYVLVGFGLRPGLMRDDELAKAVDDVIEWAGAELERRVTHGSRSSDVPDPEEVLDAFGQKFSPCAVDVLQALTDRRLRRSTDDEAQARLRQEIARASRNLELAGALAKGARGGDSVLLLSASTRHAPGHGGQRSVSFEPEKGGQRNRPGYWLWEPPPDWENEGPWGGSLAWLEQQERPEAEERCERCNWQGRYPHLIGIDDGSRPTRVVQKAKRGSVGRRKPLLDRYREGDDSFGAIDHMQGAGDHRCALCGGRGYVPPDSWEADPRLRRRCVRHPGADDQNTGQLQESFDAKGRLRPLWDRTAESSTTETGDPAVGDDGGAEWSEGLDVLRDERLMVRRILAAADRYHARGRTLLEGATVDAHKRDYEETPAVLEPLALRQFLADARFTGSGRTDPERRWAFQQRDAVVFELVVLGVPLERISEALGLSMKRLYSLAAVKAAQKVFEQNQRGIALHWHERGYTTRQVARALGLPLWKVQRIVREGSSRKPESAFAGLAEVIRLAAMYAQVLERMQLFPQGAPSKGPPPSVEEIRDGLPIDYYERVPPGMPLSVEAEPYHSYVPGEQEERGSPDGDPRSPEVLHPFLHALLSQVGVDVSLRCAMTVRLRAAGSAMSPQSERTVFATDG